MRLRPKNAQIEKCAQDQRPNSGCNWDNSFKSFPPCYSHCFYKRILLPPPLSKSDLKLFCNVNNVFGNLKSEISQDYDQKSQLNCICKPFKEPRNRIPAWRVGTTIPYLTYRPARLNRGTNAGHCI
jgi:hypothetical protein